MRVIPHVFEHPVPVHGWSAAGFYPYLVLGSLPERGEIEVHLLAGCENTASSVNEMRRRVADFHIYGFADSVAAALGCYSHPCRPGSLCRLETESCHFVTCAAE